MIQVEITENYLTDLQNNVSDTPRSSIVRRPILPSLASHVSAAGQPTTALSQPIVLTTDQSEHNNNNLESRVESRATSVGEPTEGGSNQDFHGQQLGVYTCIDQSRRCRLTRSEENSISEDDQHAFFQACESNVLIFSSAGKPIYYRHGTEQVVAGYMGILQAVLGFYDDRELPDRIQSFSSLGFTAVFLTRGQIYLAVLSKLCQSELLLRLQLEFVYDVIVSNLTATAIKRIVSRGSNFDLRRQLVDRECFIDDACDDMTYGQLVLSIMFTSLPVLRLRSTFRKQINAIVQHSRPKSDSLLYGILVSDKRLISIIRPNGHSLYPADLRLLFETVYTKGFEEGQEFWLPLCLPRFNDSGFLYLFVNFIARGIAIILISTDKDAFFELQAMKDEIMRKFRGNNLLDELIKAQESQCSTTTLKIDDVVDHFVYKSRSRLQLITVSTSGTLVGHSQIVKIYGTVQATMMNKHNYQISNFPAELMRNDEKRSGIIKTLSWFTQAFELIVIANPIPEDDNSIPVSRLIAAANKINKHVRREGQRLWVDESVTF